MESLKQININVENKYFFFRRCLELLSIFLVSPLILILFLILTFIVFIDLRRNIIYKQIRVGMNGKPFTMYKFRTMKECPKYRNDYFAHQKERVTKLGDFLRKHKLDELPQVWNVMKGDMSIIGPRPEMIEAYFYFLNSIPDYSKRKIIPQGITGWAQVNYNHTMSVEGNSRKLEFDIFYINNLSLKLDLIILIKTMKTVFTGNNSE